MLGYFPKKNLFFFESFHGKQYSDNPRAIYEYIQKAHPEYHCVWAVKKGYEQPFIDANVPYVSRLGIRWLCTMPRAQYWVFNTRMPLWMKKGKGTTYIQTWHGTPLKKLGLDIQSVKMPGIETETYKEAFVKETQRWNYLISPNSYSSNIFQGAFGFEGTILETGYPRNDLLVDEKNLEENRREIKKKLKIDQHKKIVLYAPTWRDDHYFVKGAYRFDNRFPFEELLQTDENLVILVRLHYLVAETLDLSQYGERVLDCSSYEDVKELLVIADLLITDYSSVLFDYAITDKPMIFYMYDYQKYREEIRGFYFDPVPVLPGPVVKTEVELVSRVSYFLSTGHLDYLQRYMAFKKEFVHLSEAGASQEILNKIADKT
ncbi:CDP-glycerol glycerophosphotransferase family protein [Enterococcus sp. BWB1-3]|nr:CDP-glycerol glycerophosphotransferase family protein [Enterococcus sp. BWB1-3]